MTGAYLTALLAGIVALALLAKQLRVPYPVVFVLGGLAVALIPGVPTVELQPDLVFLLFLPPLIFGDGWTTDYRSFIRYRTPIFTNALGLVVCTSVAVAFAVHWMIGVPLAIGFVLGGVLSPTDAVATDAIAEEVSLPHRLMSIISGESLINDASGLVIFRFALVAVATGTFSLLFAVGQFIYVAAAGVGVGLAGGWLIAKLMVIIRKKGLSDNLISVSLSLVAPFALYVPADAIGASGVLAALSGGILLSRKSSQIFDADSRIAASSVWNLLFFVFNGAAFLLIGLQLRAIVRALPEYSLATLIGWGIAVWLVLVAVRFAFVYSFATVTWRWLPRLRSGEGVPPTWQALFVLAFTGMRGIVSLAAALAIPEFVAQGVPFPDRALLLFITFVVILLSLVGEGLALPVLIRRFGDKLGFDESNERALAVARSRTAAAARAHLRSLEQEFVSPAEWEVAGRLQAAYEDRETHYLAHADGAAPDDDAQQHAIEQRLRREAHGAERRVLLELRRTGQIGDDVYRTVEWELDIDESHLS